MKITNTYFEIIGRIIKDDDRYVVKDNTNLKNLVVSSTSLKPHKSTSGHSHKGQEEVYFFVKGSGVMIIKDKSFVVNSGDVVLIPDGDFHQVINKGMIDLCFICVFNGKRK